MQLCVAPVLVLGIGFWLAGSLLLLLLWLAAVAAAGSLLLLWLAAVAAGPGFAAALGAGT